MMVSFKPPETKCLLIKGGTIITMNPSEEIIKGGYILIEKNRIIEVGEIQKAPPDHTVGEIIDVGDCLVMPGLINTHTHAAMSCLRGLADDLPLKSWLEKYIFPVEARHVNPDFVYYGTLLAGLEMIRSGTTCFCDGYFFEEEAAKAALELGIRAVLGEGIVDSPTPDVPDAEMNIENAKKFLEQTPSTSLITLTLFCHSPYTCNPETLRKANELCQHYSVPLLIHLAETETEVKEIETRYQASPVQHLLNLGLLDHETIAAHCVWISPEDLVLLEKKEVRIAHCPESNMKLASGVAPVPEFLSLGIPVGLGTDGCASNNNLDLMSEMDTAAKLHKLVRKDPAVMDVKTILRMATIGGAEVLGLQDEVGSLEPGKKADIIILNWNQPHLTPVYNYYSHLVYSASGHDVQSVFVDGKMIMDNRRILTVNEKEVINEVKRIGRKIRGSISLPQER